MLGILRCHLMAQYSFLAYDSGCLLGRIQRRCFLSKLVQACPRSRGAVFLSIASVETSTQPGYPHGGSKQANKLFCEMGKTTVSADRVQYNLMARFRRGRNFHLPVKAQECSRLARQEIPTVSAFPLLSIEQMGSKQFHFYQLHDQHVPVIAIRGVRAPKRGLSPDEAENKGSESLLVPPFLQNIAFQGSWQFCASFEREGLAKGCYVFGKLFLNYIFPTRERKPETFLVSVNPLVIQFYYNLQSDPWNLPISPRIQPNLASLAHRRPKTQRYLRK